MTDQLSLFSATEQWQVNGRTLEGLSPDMSLAALRTWQERIGDFQRRIRFVPEEEQTSLFDLSAPQGASQAGTVSELRPSLRAAESGGGYRISKTAAVTPLSSGSSPETQVERLDPFTLPQQNINFWQSPVQEVGVAALYFVIDYEQSVLLYVGETIHSNKRWKGVHDCKRYLSNYRQVHYNHELTTHLGIGFWPHAPKATRPRQRLESKLIKKWRPPFNKENWSFWGTPFVGGKIEKGD